MIINSEKNSQNILKLAKSITNKPHVDTISRKDNISDIVEILKFHDIKMGVGWQFILGTLFDKCESHLEVHGFGDGAYFAFV
jgi:hypothetical protein